MDADLCSQAFLQQLSTGPHSLCSGTVWWANQIDLVLSAATGRSTEAKAFISAHISAASLFLFLVFHLIKLITTHGTLAVAAAQLSQIYMNLFSVERSRGNFSVVRLVRSSHHLMLPLYLNNVFMVIYYLEWLLPLCRQLLGDHFQILNFSELVL